MSSADEYEYVITFPIAGGIFGVARLATRLNELLDRDQIGPWHIGQWTDFKHTAIGIGFRTAIDGEVANHACLNAGSRSPKALSDG